MTVNGATSHWDQIRAALRALGVRAGLKGGEVVGLPLLIAAVAKTAGADAAQKTLRSAGVKDPEAFLAAVPDVRAADADRLPELRADAKLSKLLTGELADLVAGNLRAAEALKRLLSPEVLGPDGRRFLADPAMVFGNRCGDQLYNTRQLVQALAAHYQRRFHAGYRYFVVDAQTGDSAFLREDTSGIATKLADDLRRHERKANATVFGSCLYDRSPLGACRRKYGEFEAHIVGAAILGEMAVIGNGPLSVRSLTWAVDPYRYHRMAGLVLERLTYLRGKGVLGVCPDDDDIRLHTHVLAAPGTMREWLTFLREADPITSDEVKDIVGRLY